MNGAVGVDKGDAEGIRNGKNDLNDITLAGRTNGVM